MDNPPLLTIIIPTFNRPRGLEKLLASILVQNLSLFPFEVVVIDNAAQPLEENRQVVENAQRSGLPVVLFHEPVPGSAIARNSGIKHAQGSWLAFLDDDEELNPLYFEALAPYLARGDQYLLVGGECLPVWDAEPPHWMKADYFCISYGNIARDLVDREYLPGGNLVMAKSLVNLAGGYPTDFGHFGNSLGYGEDTLFMQKARAQGGKQFSDPGLAIFHHIPASRMSITWMTRQKKLSSIAKAKIYLMDHPISDTVAGRLRLKFYYLRMTVQGWLKMTWLRAAELLRDQKRYPNAENYLVEVVLPQLARYQINLTLFSLIPLLGKPKK